MAPSGHASRAWSVHAMRFSHSRVKGAFINFRLIYFGVCFIGVRNPCAARKSKAPPSPRFAHRSLGRFERGSRGRVPIRSLGVPRDACGASPYSEPDAAMPEGCMKALTLAPPLS